KHADKRRVLVLAYLRLPLLAERTRCAEDVRQLLDRCVRLLDRLLVLRVGDLARLRVEDDRTAAVLLRREARLEQVRRGLAVRPRQIQVVARIAAEGVDERHHPRDQDDPGAENDPLVAGGEESEAVKDPSHVTRRDVSIRLSAPSVGHRLGADNVRPTTWWRQRRCRRGSSLSPEPPGPAARTLAACSPSVSAASQVSAS